MAVISALIGFPAAQRGSHAAPKRRGTILLRSSVLVLLAGASMFMAIIAMSGTFLIIQGIEINAALEFRPANTPTVLYGGYLLAIVFAAAAMRLGIAAHHLEQQLPDNDEVVALETMLTEPVTYHLPTAPLLATALRSTLFAHN